MDQREKKLLDALLPLQMTIASLQNIIDHPPKSISTENMDLVITKLARAREAEIDALKCLDELHYGVIKNKDD